MSICAIHSHPWPSHFHTQILSQLVGSPHPKTAHEIRRPPGALENLHSKLQKNGWAWGKPLTKKGNNLGYTGLGWGKRLQSKKSFSFDQLINLCCQLLALEANHWGRPAGWVLPYGLICCCLYRGYMNQTSYVVGVQTSYDCKTCWWVVTKMFNRPSFLGWWSQAAWHCFCCCCCRRLLFLSQKNIITKMPCFMCLLIGLF